METKHSWLEFRILRGIIGLDVLQSVFRTKNNNNNNNKKLKLKTTHTYSDNSEEMYTLTELLSKCPLMLNLISLCLSLSLSLVVYCYHRSAN